MKLVALLTLIFSTASFAGLGRTFTTTEDIDIRSMRGSGYTLDKEISVLVERVTGKTADIYLDNNFKQIEVKQISSEPGKQTYEGTLKIDIIAPRIFCEEYEEVTYKVTIEVEQYDEYRFINKAVAVKAIHDYSWDLCHDTNWGSEREIEYKLTF